MTIEESVVVAVIMAPLTLVVLGLVMYPILKGTSFIKSKLLRDHP